MNPEEKKNNQDRGTEIVLPTHTITLLKAVNEKGTKGVAICVKKKGEQELRVDYEDAEVILVVDRKKGDKIFFISKNNIVAVVIVLMLCITVTANTWIVTHSENDSGKTWVGIIVDAAEDILEKVSDENQNSDSTESAPSEGNSSEETEMEKEPSSQKIINPSNSLSKIVNDDGFIFPESNTQLLTYDNVNCLMNKCSSYSMKKQAIQWAINEMEARYGFDFSGNTEYQEFISQYEWYQKVYREGNGHHEFEGIEKENYDMLTQYRDNNF